MDVLQGWGLSNLWQNVAEQEEEGGLGKADRPDESNVQFPIVALN